MKKFRVLIVEDEAIIALDLRRTLEELGCAPLPVAATAEQAVEAARAADPDMILMDVVLKGERSGIDAALEIRTFCEKPIVFLTGNSHSLSEEIIRETGARGVFAKPTTEWQIRKMLKAALPAEAF